jgi:hypothetical protein
MFRKILASILFVIFFSTSLSLGLVWGAYDLAVDEEFQQEALPNFAYNFFVDDLPSIFELGAYDLTVDEEVLRGFATRVFLKDDVGGFVAGLISQIFDTRVERGKTTYVTISTAWFFEKKDFLATEIADYLFEKLPACEDVNSQQCIPKGLAKLDFRTEISRFLDAQLFDQVEREYKFEIGLPPDYEGTLGQLTSGTFRVFLLTTGMSLLLLLIFISLLIFSPLTSVFRWLAFTIFAPSLLIVLLGMMFKAFPVSFDVSLSVADLGVPAQNFIIDLVKFLGLHYSENLVSKFTHFAVVSFGVWILTFVVAHSKKT